MLPLDARTDLTLGYRTREDTMIYDRDSISDDAEEAASSIFALVLRGALLAIAIWLGFWEWLQILLTIGVVITSGVVIFFLLKCTFKLTVNLFALLLYPFKFIPGAIKAAVLAPVRIGRWLFMPTGETGFARALAALDKSPNALRIVVAAGIFGVMLIGGYDPHPDFSARFLVLLLASGLLMELIVIGLSRCVRALARRNARKTATLPPPAPPSAAPESDARQGTGAAPETGTATHGSSAPAPGSESAEPDAGAEPGKNAETDGNAEPIGTEMPDEKAVPKDIDAGGTEEGDRKGTELG